MDISNAEKIYEIMERFRRNMTHKKMNGEIPHSEFKLLKVIQRKNAEGEEVTVSTLSEQMGVSKPAISQLINHLEEKEYLERVFTRNDRRLVYVRLTGPGEQFLAEHYQKFLLRMTEIFDKLGEKDTEELLRLLEKLYEIVTDRNEKETSSNANQGRRSLDD